MKVISALPCNQYLREMKQQMGSFTDFGMERFTGIILGSFFSITYHSGHEFNRRITNEKHRAIGFVRSCEEGTHVCCIRLAGMTNPMSLLGIYCFCVILWLVLSAEIAFSAEALVINLFITAVTALITAFTDSITERGQEGSKIVTAFLIDPSDYYSLINKI